MILTTFNWNFPSVSVRHEFGHQQYKKMLVINLLFCTIFIIRDAGSRISKMMQVYVNDPSVECLPQYREQIKRIKSKARKQAEKDHQRYVKSLIEDRDRYYKDYINLNSKISGLKNLAYQVRNIKSMCDDELKNI